MLRGLFLAAFVSVCAVAFRNQRRCIHFDLDSNIFATLPDCVPQVVECVVGSAPASHATMYLQRLFTSS